MSNESCKRVDANIIEVTDHDDGSKYLFNLTEALRFARELRDDLIREEEQKHTVKG